MEENGEAKEETKGMEKEKAKDRAKEFTVWTSWEHGEVMRVGMRTVVSNGGMSRGEDRDLGKATD